MEYIVFAHVHVQTQLLYPTLLMHGIYSLVRSGGGTLPHCLHVYQETFSFQNWEACSWLHGQSYLSG